MADAKLVDVKLADAKLVIVGGAQLKEVQLKNLPATIGRARNSTITLPHKLVSRKHCEIFEQDGQLFVKDLNSLNGTYLNNEKINGSHSLLPNQLLTIGNVTFRVIFPGNSPVDSEDTPDEWKQGETIPAEFEYRRQPTNGRAFREYDHQANGCPSAAENSTPEECDTDEQDFRPVAESHILVIDDTVRGPDPSISLGAIGKLPHDAREGASFTGGISIESDRQQLPVNVDSLQIDVGESDVNREPPSQSSIDSFIRKLPK